jgi:hypothetical protein
VRDSVWDDDRGSKVGGFTLLGQGSGNASAVGLHTGDINHARFEDITIDSFTGANSACMWWDNQAGFSERNTISHIELGVHQAASGVVQNGCTKHIRFTVTGGGSISFGHNQWYGVHESILTGQTGWSVEGTSQLYDNVIFGNANMSGGTVMSVTSTTSMPGNFIFLMAEATAAATGLSTGAGVNFQNLGPGIVHQSADTNITNSITAGTLTTPAFILKNGSGGGNYTGTNTSYANVDTTALCQVVTIPVGWRLNVSVTGNLFINTALVQGFASVADIGTTCGGGGVTALKEIAVNSPSIGLAEPFALNWVINGDGAAHAVSLQAKTANASDAWTIPNAGVSLSPAMVLTLMPSN